MADERYADALMDYDAAIALAQEDTDLYKLRAECFRVMGDMASALDDYERADDLMGAKCCMICMEERRNCRLHPCMHAALCTSCAAHMKDHAKPCPICGKAIDSVEVGTFLKTFALDATILSNIQEGLMKTPNGRNAMATPSEVSPGSTMNVFASPRDSSAMDASTDLTARTASDNGNTRRNLWGGLTLEPIPQEPSNLDLDLSTAPDYGPMPSARSHQAPIEEGDEEEAAIDSAVERDDVSSATPEPASPPRALRPAEADDRRAAGPAAGTSGAPLPPLPPAAAAPPSGSGFSGRGTARPRPRPPVRSASAQTSPEAAAGPSPMTSPDGFSRAHTPRSAPADSLVETGLGGGGQFFPGGAPSVRPSAERELAPASPRTSARSARHAPAMLEMSLSGEGSSDLEGILREMVDSAASVQLTPGALPGGLVTPRRNFE